MEKEKVTRDDCSICLEDRVVSSHCCVNVCASCHDVVRGLCPVCDRKLLHAGYECGCCGSVVKLSDFAHPCMSCGLPSLCGDCYIEYGSCECES